MTKKLPEKVRAVAGGNIGDRRFESGDIIATEDLGSYADALIAQGQFVEVETTESGRAKPMSADEKAELAEEAAPAETTTVKSRRNAAPKVQES